MSSTLDSGLVPRHALIFGASGLVGRHLVLRLAEVGAQITAAVRTVESGQRLTEWLRRRGFVAEISLTIADFEAESIVAGGATAWEHITEIHNCAGVYRFGMTADEARSANVGIVESILEFAQDLPHLRRVMHISGYRVGGQDPLTVPWADDYRRKRYKELGAYEASKVESDAVFQARAQELGMPWTIVNPSSVIGDSETGESDQQIGLADTISQVWEGSTPALPGGDSTFLPVVTVDYLAGFMVAAAVDQDAVGNSYWVLDTSTPPLQRLLTTAGRQLGAKVPRLRVPVSVITRLPRWLTRADPETLTFLSSDRYPTQAAEVLAERNGLRMPDVEMSMERWVDHLAAHRFGKALQGARRFVPVGGVKTFELGPADASLVILPGLPVNADSWAAVANGAGARVLDLPGLGLSLGAGVTDWEEWVPNVLGREPVHLVGHSIGAAAAVTAATQNPEKIASLTLVAPFFLQPSSRVSAWQRLLIRAALKHITPEQLSLRLTGSRDSGDALETSVQDLRRGAARNVAEHLARAGSEVWRKELRDQLLAFEGPVRVVTGTNDPLLTAVTGELEKRPNVIFHTIEGAGHHPQLTHARQLAQLIGAPDA